MKEKTQRKIVMVACVLAMICAIICAYIEAKAGWVTNEWIPTEVYPMANANISWD